MVGRIASENDRQAFVRSLAPKTWTATSDVEAIVDLIRHAFSPCDVALMVVEDQSLHFKELCSLRGSTVASLQSHCLVTLSTGGLHRASIDASGGNAPLLQFWGLPVRDAEGLAFGVMCVLLPAGTAVSPQNAEMLEKFSRLIGRVIATSRQLGRRDPSTGLPNRQQLNWDLSRLDTLGDEEGALFLCVLEVCSPQRSKRFAELLSPEAFESCIRQLAFRLTDAIAARSVVYQVGEERFAFLLRSHSEAAIATQVSHIQTVVSRSIDAGGVSVQADLYAGVVPLRRGIDGLWQGIVAAQIAMNENRRLAFYSRLEELAAQRRFRLVSDLRGAVFRQEFFLMFQPRLSLKTDRIASVEALIRWEHPQLGRIAPSEFVPLLEGTAQMCEVTRWVIDTALEQARLWEAVGLDLGVSINVSAADFESGDLPQLLLSALNRIGLPASRLEVEVSESQWLHDGPSVKHQLTDLQTMGVRVSLDDFGAGFCNFCYLQDLPVNCLKIDRSLIDQIEVNSRRAEFVRALIKLAGDLGFEAVAEGVENRPQLGLLKSWGCDEVQGYFVAKPLMASEVTAESLSMLRGLVGPDTPSRR